MPSLQIRLFGKLCIQNAEQILFDLEARKAQELFAYLLLYRNRPHSREALSTILSNESARDQSLKALRQTLWQIQSVLDTQTFGQDCIMMHLDSAWVQINPQCDYWLDVAVLEQRFAAVQGVPGRALDGASAEALIEAAELYRGDLMEDCYQDWCLYERERFQNMYLAILDKLMDYCEAHGEYEAGLVYGTQILRYDRACERAYRRMMRLYYRAGDRTAALRRYAQCVTALEEELGVTPARRTMDLYDEIKADQLLTALPGSVGRAATSADATSLLSNTLTRLKYIQTLLVSLQGKVEEDIQTMETLVAGSVATRPNLYK